MQILQINHETDIVAEGCEVQAKSKGQSGITYGAGSQFHRDINESAEHNLLIVGL